MKISIGITTTPNRKEIFEQSYKQWVKYLPEDAVLFTHNDINYDGIAKAKNVCVRACHDADFVFIVDDDCYPIKENWHLPYIESGLNHAMYIFDRELILTACDIDLNLESGWYQAFNLPRGCMLFFTRRCIKTAGGFDERFTGWGYEHAELSRRIYNMGLTPDPYIDIPYSKGLFYSHDEHGTCESSVSNIDRMRGIQANQGLFNELKDSKEFKPFK